MSKIVTIQVEGVDTSYTYSSVEIVGDQTIYRTSGAVPNPPGPQPTECVTKPTGVLLPNGQQLFANFLPGTIQSFELPQDCRTAKVTKMTGTPTNAKWSIFLSKCPGVKDEISASPNGSVGYNYNGGPIKFTRGPANPAEGECHIPERAYVNFVCSVASPAVIQRSA